MTKFKFNFLKNTYSISDQHSDRVPVSCGPPRDPPRGDGVRVGVDGGAAREDVADPRHGAVTKHVVAPVAAPLIPNTRLVGDVWLRSRKLPQNVNKSRGLVVKHRLQACP